MQAKIALHAKRAGQGENQGLRKASNVRILLVKPPFSPKAASSRPWSAKPFMLRLDVHRAIEE